MTCDYMEMHMVVQVCTLCNDEEEANECLYTEQLSVLQLYTHHCKVTSSIICDKQLVHV